MPRGTRARKAFDEKYGLRGMEAEIWPNLGGVYRWHPDQRSADAVGIRLAVSTELLHQHSATYAWRWPLFQTAHETARTIWPGLVGDSAKQRGPASLPALVL